MGIDIHGLDDMDRRILIALIDQFKGGPVGVNSLSVAVSEDATTIEDELAGELAVEFPHADLTLYLG